MCLEETLKIERAWDKIKVLSRKREMTSRGIRHL
jgi:hypothetical protein